MVHIQFFRTNGMNRGVLTFCLSPNFCLVFYGILYFPGGPDDIRRVFTLDISELAILAIVYFLMYGAEAVAPYYFLRS